MKTCTECKVEKPLDQFAKDRSQTTGYRSRCKACQSERSRRLYAADQALRQRAIDRARNYLQEHGLSEKSKERKREYKEERRRAAGALPLAEHKAKLASQAAQRRDAAKKHNKATFAQTGHSAHVQAWRAAKPGAAWSHRYRTDPAFNAREKVRARLRKLAAADTDLQQHMAEQVKAGRFSAKWRALLGYSMHDLVRHLRRTLPKGATWEQFLSGELHIDHITPRAAFDLADIAEVRACWSLGNLRLLSKDANLAKGAKVEVLL